MSKTSALPARPDSWEDDPTVWLWIRRIFVLISVLLSIVLTLRLLWHQLPFWGTIVGSSPQWLDWPWYISITLGVLLGAQIGVVLFSSRRLAVLGENTWVTILVSEVKRRLQNEPLVGWTARNATASLLGIASLMVGSRYQPRRSAIILGFLAFVISSLAFYMVGNPVDMDVPSRYLTLWQLHAGLASIALPLLVFIINYGGDNPRARQQKTRALVIETHVMHILLVLAGSLVAFGFGAQWPGGNAYWVGMAIFIVGVGLTMSAFLSLLYLVSRPSRLEEASLQLLGTLFDEQIESALDERIGANLVRKVLEEGGASYNPYWSKRPEYDAIDAPEVGIVEDVHIGRLREFLKLLTESKTDGGDSTDIIWRYGYSDRIRDGQDAVVLLREEAFSRLDTELLAEKLSRVLTISESV